MKMAKRRWPVLATGVLLVALGGTALAFGPDGAPRGHGLLGAVYQLEGLTDTQRQQLDALRDRQRTAAKEQREAWRSERQALRKALRDGADPATIRPLAERQGQRVAERIVKRAELRQAVEAILTPDQRQALAKALENRRSGKGCHRPWGNQRS